MSQRRRFLAGLSAISVSLGSGCLSSVTDQFGAIPGSTRSDRGEIARTYTDVLEVYNSGIGAQERSTSAFDDAEYGTAATKTREAIERFETAQESFTGAEEKARTIGEDDAAEICQNAAERVRLMGEAARAGRKAVQTAADGKDAVTVNEHVNTHRSDGKRPHRLI
jgi:hypothetical protein